ncbi:Eco57I restriction-modification methylase domain-containing protein [Rhodococcus sp. BP-332]|uniref:Eco57I restriction-modification methylase domain-containing protein n=1 Tax=Rhodococcus sp. BP-332 TaxID=2739447 RepID=UPI0027DFF72E|nr:DNA methyltransferase [Rhodococcus sp. BP-332]
MTELHRAWLELVDTEGPFLAIPPLKRVWPQGMPALGDDRKAALADARKDFEAAWERFDRTPDDDAALEFYRVARDKWVETFLRDVAGWADSLSWGEAPGVQAQSPNRNVTVTAQAALNGVDGIGALVHVVDPTDSLRKTPNDLWAATPVDRTEALLRENSVELGIVTDGRWWGLVCVREGAMAASGIVDCFSWTEEPRTRDAYLALIGRQHIIGGDPAERLPVLFQESIAAAEEITEALGAQVRSAVELLIQSFSESAADANRRGLADPLPVRKHDTYEAAVTVMMRVVFLLFAEERGLLPSGELFDQGYGIARELDRLIARETQEGEEALDSTSLTWHRLLATSQALFSGASLEGLRMPAYGGSLFNPGRFQFLIAVNEQGTLKVTVPDRVMLHVLRSVQVADIRGEARRISFRDIDVEQIGYIYEGLLGYTAIEVNEAYVGLKGARGAEPEIPLATLEQFAESESDPSRLAAAIRTWVEQDQPSAKAGSAKALTKSLTTDVEPSVVSALTQAVGGESHMSNRVRPWLGLIRLDLRKRPFVVLPGGMMVRETPSRKNAGAHYTPKSLAEEVVLHALQPLCYSPGPRQTADEASWKLKSSDDLLNLKVADIACGSGAFLVAAARYLADRVLEAWIAEHPAYAARDGLHMRAIRQVVANCLYGADINDMAVEMCKLSLWLVSLDRDLPFSFVDDKVFVGNSLLGVTNLKQLLNLHIDEMRKPRFIFSEEFDVDVRGIVRKAVDLRRVLALPIDDDDPARSAATKHRQMSELVQVTAVLRRLADGVVAAAIPLGGKSGRGLDEAYENLRLAVKHADQGKPQFLEKIIENGLTPTVPTDYDLWRPLHWVIEAPEVLIEHGGFDAIIGNPPFLGFKKITPSVGKGVRDLIVTTLAARSPAKSDLAAYFVLRAWQLRAQGGTVGLITTNTISEGDTRESSLEQLASQGMEIHRSVKSTPWPSSFASLEVAIVHLGDAYGSGGARPVADGVGCIRISPMLEPVGRVEGAPRRLASNLGLGFQGSIPLGDGLLVAPGLAESWIAADPKNALVLRPYLGGNDVNSRPDVSPSRWVIDFGMMDRAQAESYREPFAHAALHSKAARANEKSAERRETWWRFAQWGPGWRNAVSKNENMIVLTIVSKPVLPARVPVGPVCSNLLEVFAREDDAFFGLLSSSLHQLWAITYGSTLETRVRYTLSDVLETFPFPPDSSAVAGFGAVLDRERQQMMVARNLGLTKIYNLVNDPSLSDNSDSDVARLRQIHADLDSAVMDAYGWSDVPLEHGFYTYRQLERWTVSAAARTEILARLLEENHRRSAADRDATGAQGGRNYTPTDDNQRSLFGDT